MAYFDMSLTEALEKDLAVVHQCLAEYNMYTLRAASLSWRDHLDYLECLFETISLPLLAQVCILYSSSSLFSDALHRPVQMNECVCFHPPQKKNRAYMQTCWIGGYEFLAMTSLWCSPLTSISETLIVLKT